MEMPFVQRSSCSVQKILLNLISTNTFCCNEWGEVVVTSAPWFLSISINWWFWSSLASSEWCLLICAPPCLVLKFSDLVHYVARGIAFEFDGPATGEPRPGVYEKMNAFLP